MRLPQCSTGQKKDLEPFLVDVVILVSIRFDVDIKGLIYRLHKLLIFQFFYFEDGTTKSSSGSFKFAIIFNPIFLSNICGFAIKSNSFLTVFAKKNLR